LFSWRIGRTPVCAGHPVPGRRDSSRIRARSKFHGVGPATARKMASLGIKTGLDLKGQTLKFLQQYFGKAGSYYYWAARGVDERPVRADRTRKSVGAENTFPADFFTYEAARDALREIIDEVWSYCDGSGCAYRLCHPNVVPMETAEPSD
jgi:nucleotidyltransferase/DNA polymerase involved in DNA repair